MGKYRALIDRSRHAGNHTCIPVNQYMTGFAIIELLNEFELAFPEFEMTDWNPIMERDHSVESLVITHKLKQPR
jgi:hypothetical protein